ncbi:hypothetical protein HQ37_01850 [Porphyromonas sp. COT-239 OH1446]|nr:hypothetical protein HQ37_01850 [Porphyromonas sp. COT-239 OH1446]
MQGLGSVSRRGTSRSDSPPLLGGELWGSLYRFFGQDRRGWGRPSMDAPSASADHAAQEPDELAQAKVLKALRKYLRDLLLFAERPPLLLRLALLPPLRWGAFVAL